MSRKFGLDQAAMIEARRLLEEKQAAEHAVINANIRAAAGIVQPGAEAQSDAASEEQPPKLASANAGNRARATGVGEPKVSTNQQMNDWLRIMSMGKSY